MVLFKVHKGPIKLSPNPIKSVINPTLNINPSQIRWQHSDKLGNSQRIQLFDKLHGQIAQKPWQFTGVRFSKEASQKNMLQV